jgi:SynChlorMet cassette protein ScmC
MHGYQLLLAGGQRWCLSSEAGLTEWLGTLAGIMELQWRSFTPSHSLFFKWTRQRRPSLSKPPSFDFKSVRIWMAERDTVAEVWNPEENRNIFFINMWWAIFPIYLDVIERGGLPLHGGLAGIDGKGIVIAGPGGTGKSTNIGRLPDPWKAYSDDESLLVVAPDGKYYAHPFPTWSDHLYGRKDSTFMVNHSLPINGIFFLEQSQADGVIPLNAYTASGLLCESALQVLGRYLNHLSHEVKRRLRLAVFNNACAISKTLPAFILKVHKDGAFWIKLKETL